MKTHILTGKPVLTSLKPLDLSTCTKQDILDYFENSYDLYETLFTSLNDDNVFYMCPDRLRLPLIFYFAHTAVVYVNKLMLARLLKERVNIEFETMFETGVDEMSWDDTENYRMGGSYKWPSIQTVVEYRQQVRNIIKNIIQETPLQLPITMDSPWWAMVMGFEHDRIHLETSSVLIRQLPVDMVTKPDGWIYGPMKHDQGVKENPIIQMEATDVTLGKPENFPSYGWDNEYGLFDCHVPRFESTKYPITNRWFLEFVKDGGYNKRELWTEDGWQWKEFKQAKHPSFWVCNKGCKGNCGASLTDYSHCQPSNNNNDFHNKNKQGVSGYWYRAMFDELDLPMDWPVEVTYHEAKAYCAWKGPEFRLPAEAERHVMRGSEKTETESTSCDIIYQDTIPANLNMQYGSSTPVNLYPANDVGFCDVYGNAWEWHEDHFNGFNGFHTHHLYDDFSSPCFDGKHYMILGGSWISTGDLASRFARYAFRPHFIQHLGFRVVRNTHNSEQANLPIRVISNDTFVLGLGETKSNINFDTTEVELVAVPSTNYHYVYESDVSLFGILQLEFGFRESMPRVLAEYTSMLTKLFDIVPGTCAVFGSGAGQLAFLLSRNYDTVLGVEICARFVDASIKLQTNQSLSVPDTYNQNQTFTLDSDVKTKNIVFKQLTWIPNEINPNDLVLMTHLHRVQNPQAWLLRLWEITKPTGLAVIASIDNRWTPKELSPILSDKLQLVRCDEIEFETDKSRLTATVTAWKHH
ncbi:uncharacterized protein LOC126818955 [Patella vulgata]|uniref:uncharacterized protein LOC126818955 n=1 Tax=Patella vulgata TaxID=6465 RepID=UPI00217FBF4A|nr:uncharacterized protein LOC126818955 [Patella vulgata]